jgi:hypothetical protein
MSKQARYNQILFLMTLSVYMGLVLAGGASPALAQAAMAKGFELKTELEAKDDLDKKPREDDEALHSLLEEYLADSADFLTTLHRFNQNNKKFDADRDKFSVSETRYTFCDQDRVDVSFQSESALETILALSLKGKRLLADCVFNPQYQADQRTANTRLKISYDKLFLKIEYSAKKQSQQSAEHLSALLSNSFFSWKPLIDASFTKTLYENTRISSDNDQIFIITNLPRAGLDELLAAQVGK